MRSARPLCISCLFVACLPAAPSPALADDFAIRDGDTVVFLGDSITAARAYGKLIENYTLLRFPNRRVRFINAGRGGDTAAGGLERLDRDVFERGATLLIVAYGVNDIGWGLHADDEHKQKYLDAVAGIVRRCGEQNIRVYICSAAVTGADPETSEESFLQTMCDEGMALSRELGGNAIDVQRTMRAIQKRVWAANASIDDPTKHSSLHVADGVHLSDLGQIAMAYAILKGLGAPADVSACAIDAAGLSVTSASGCTISDLSGSADSLEFVRSDDGLPLNGELFFALNFRFVPIHEDLNRYMLQITSLPPGRYAVTADGRGIATYTAGQLAEGVNISSATTDPWIPGGPWSAQANILHSLTESRDRLTLADTLLGAQLPESRLATEAASHARDINSDLEELQRVVAAARPYRFRIERAAEEPPPGR